MTNATGCERTFAACEAYVATKGPRDRTAATIDSPQEAVAALRTRRRRLGREAVLTRYSCAVPLFRY
jgi:hypothetical protein